MGYRLPSWAGGAGLGVKYLTQHGDPLRKRQT
ncbi:rCG63173 [Rattus norvegicus]|uniref:RCG63173 n=1 Tax=Rattus norvegicus TaxID=10116 RepID=A6K1L4_RAT|nr:rCG63173 [Rattus norvegicus]